MQNTQTRINKGMAMFLPSFLFILKFTTLRSITPSSTSTPTYALLPMRAGPGARGQGGAKSWELYHYNDIKIIAIG